ncbi:tRNA1(Val) (adenine(37)-N6)-methyltransferase [Paracoccus tegillarcae]|uniref:Methyltransferase n=1 Tax=Paracoccus tegillarcae TaxID=1529068 RepID=A0A2K9EZN8_9RHOB|nr:methyltransferase [Paracoccus tegillarcae]AUH33572.1 methyltransferase [Paracoccus tegillarcae]
MSDLTQDGFLDGRLLIAQPVRGYRSGADAVMLAAACSAERGQSVLELGCGAGVASLCLGWRVPDLRLTGLERQANYADLARQNAQANGIAMRVITGDLAAMPAELRAESYDHVIANPPYFLNGTCASDDGRTEARHEQTALSLWVDAALRRLRPDGRVTLIHRADRLDAILAGLGARAGAIVVLPIAARPGREAGRVIVTARKGARTPLRLLAPLITHQAPSHLRDGEDLSQQSADILRAGRRINLG